MAALHRYLDGKPSKLNHTTSSSRMPNLFHESSLGRSVSLQEIEGALHLKVSKTANLPSPDTPTIDKAKVAIAHDDVYIVDSLRSGVGRTKETSVYGRILRPLLDDVLQIKHTYLGTESPAAIAKFAAGLVLQNRPITLIIIAGDTSINELVNALGPGSQSVLKLLVIPAGTGNSLALSIGLTDEAAAIKKLVLYQDADVRPLNLYEAQFPPGSYILLHDDTKIAIEKPLLFLVVASWAFHASLVADSDTDELRKFGIERFKIAAGQNLARPQNYEGNLSITRQGSTVVLEEGPFAYFVVTPSKKFEPTFEILPKGNIFDSNLYVVGFPTEESDNYIMDIMMEVYAGGKHVENSKVFYHLVEKEQLIELHVKNTEQLQKRRFCVDGAIVVLPEQLESDVRISYHGPHVNGWNVSIIS